MTQRIVLLFGAGLDAAGSSDLDGDSSQLLRSIESAKQLVSVDVISWGPARQIVGVSNLIELDVDDRGVIDLVLNALGAFALRRRFEAFPLGRLLNSLGPVAQGRVFWRAVRRNAEATRLLASADVAVAADIAAVKSAWLVMKREWVADSYYNPSVATNGIAFALPVERTAGMDASS